MRLQQLLFFFIILLGSAVSVFANKQMLTPAEDKLYVVLERAIWKQTIQPKDEDAIRSGLASEKQDLHQLALANVALHNLAVDSLPELREQVDAIRSFAAAHDASFSEWPNTEELDATLLVAAVSKVKNLRSRGGKGTQSISGDAILRLFGEYATQEEAAAVSRIIERLEFAKVAGGEMSSLATVLRSYVGEYEEAVLSALEDEARVAKMAPYGTVLLLQSVKPLLLVNDNYKKRLIAIATRLSSSAEPPIARTARQILSTVDYHAK